MGCFHLIEDLSAFEKAVNTEIDYFDTPSLDLRNWTEINWSKHSCQGCPANCHQSCLLSSFEEESVLALGKADFRVQFPGPLVLFVYLKKVSDSTDFLAVVQDTAV